MSKMQTIVLVSNTSNYFNMTIGSKLKEEYDIIETTMDAEELAEVPKDASAWLIFLDKEMLEEQHKFQAMRDRVLDEEVPVFFIGYKDEIEEAKKSFMGCRVEESFARPIDVNDIVKTVDDYIKENENQEKKKILVVDDSGAILRAVKKLLEEKYQVALANSGAMAIKYLALNRPDLVLLDYEMPVVDGKQVLEIIRSEREFAGIPVIFLTGKSDRESVMNVMDLKPEGYLLKTMPPKEILKNIDEFFAKRKKRW